jgi:hypothetical protein
MRLLVLLLPLACVALAFWAGHALSQRSTGLPRADRKELVERRAFMDDLSTKAVEHSMLGDHFSVIVLDMLTKFRKKMPQ